MIIRSVSKFDCIITRPTFHINICKWVILVFYETVNVFGYYNNVVAMCKVGNKL